MSDQTIQCSDCGDDFLFSERDQAFFTQQGYTPPKRCKACRAVRKANQPQGQKGSRNG
jgi:hypothetical protein